MSRKTVSLRPAEALLSAYLLSPLASLCFLWVSGTVSDLMSPNRSFLRDVFVIPWLLFFGGAFCIVAEILVANPIVILFKRFRWGWLNGWFASAIGFMTGISCWLLFNYQHVFGFAGSNVVLDEAILECVDFGLAGALGGVTFRLLAIERYREPKELTAE